MLKIHILGANGYLGSLLYYHLEKNGFFIEKASYRLPDVPEKSIDADIVIHLSFAGGGTAHKPRYGNDDPDYMYRVNVEGMNNLLRGLKNKNSKIIFISSTAVYGKFNDMPVLNEEAKLLATSIYGQHKIEAEKVLINSSFKWMILRPCGIFGPSLYSNFGNSFLNTVLFNAISKNQISIINGKQKIDTLYNFDLIRIILRICEGEWFSNEIFNVGGEIVSIKNMLNILADQLKKSGYNCSVTNIETSVKPAILTDSTKLKTKFNGRTQTPLNNSLEKLVKAYINQK